MRKVYGIKWEGDEYCITLTCSLGMDCVPEPAGVSKVEGRGRGRKARNRHAPIMLLKLPIMLLSNASNFSLLCSNYARLCSIMLT